MTLKSIFTFISVFTFGYIRASPKAPLPKQDPVPQVNEDARWEQTQTMALTGESAKVQLNVSFIHSSNRLGSFLFKWKSIWLDDSASESCFFFFKKLILTFIPFKSFHTIRYEPQRYKLASSHFIVSLQKPTSKIHAEILFKLNFCCRRPRAEFLQTRRTCPVSANPAAKRPPERFC